jgi:hypothetical protein
MTLLTVCQDVADVIGLTRPTAIITGTDQLSRQMLAFAKETVEELGRMDWPTLEIPYEFTTTPNVATYALPADFGREIGDTAYEASQYYPLRGSLTPGDWARARNALPAQIGRYKFRIFGLPPQINITPTPQLSDTFVFEYQTTYRVQQQGGAYATTFNADSDTSITDEDLLRLGIKWRLRRAKGLDYSEEFNAYETMRKERLAQKLTAGSMPVAYRNLIDIPGLPLGGYVPEQGFGV